MTRGFYGANIQFTPQFDPRNGPAIIRLLHCVIGLSLGASKFGYNII